MNGDYPHRIFMTYDCSKQRKYYLSLYRQIPAMLIDYVKGMDEFDNLSKHNRIRAFKKVEALHFCINYINNESTEYAQHRGFEYKRIKTLNLAEKHIEKAIFYLERLTHNKNNIDILKSIEITVPPDKPEYYNDIRSISSNILADAGFSPNLIQRTLLPYLTKLYKDKIDLF